jgi:hypothetical protein
MPGPFYCAPGFERSLYLDGKMLWLSSVAFKEQLNIFPACAALVKVLYLS